MSKYLCYKDTVKLVETSAPDGYGDIEPVELTDLQCDFFTSTGSSHSNNVDIVNSDAYAYIDPQNPEVVARAYRLEGMLIVANLFGGVDNESWFKITTVRIGQDKLRFNKIDNVQIYMKKTEAL